MKLNRKRIREGVIIATLILLFGGVAAKISQAQEDRNKPAPESPPSETPSAPAESARPSESSPSSNDTSSSNSGSNNSSNNDSNRGADSGNSSSSSNDNGNRSESRRSKDDSSKPRHEDNGTRNTRERIAMPKMPVTAASENGGGNSAGRRDRDRNRDWDGSRRHDGARGHDRNRHRHRQDECYRVPAYDDTISYSAGTYGQSGGAAQVSLSAYDRGYEDGLYTGANDARRGQTYDPERSHFYDDTPGYHSVMGTRDVYKRAYRDGFLRGYREGYQNWQKYFSGGVFHR